MNSFSYNNIDDDEIVKFIKTFKGTHPKEIEEVFLFGDCYWFAFILNNRFKGQICYLPIMNHFIFRWDTNGLYYDIRGAIISSMDEKVYIWDEYQEIEPLGSERIKRDCILKV